MSVSNGQNANQTTFNNAFMSRTTNDSTVGKKSFNNTTDAAASDGSIICLGGIYVAKKILVDAQAQLKAGIAFDGGADPASTGANQDITLAKPFVVFTNNSLTSIRNLILTAGQSLASMIVLKNGQSGQLKLINEGAGTAANRILTGTNSDLTLGAGASVFLLYDFVNSRWQVVGGSGGANGTIPTGTAQTLTNNSAGQTVTSLIFDKTLMRSSEVKWQAYRKSTGGLGVRVQRGSFFVIHDDTNWSLTYGPMSGVDAGLAFDINISTGQVIVDADDNGGTPVTQQLIWDIAQTMGL